MRINGKTTRMVDVAIQELFTNGSIYIPTKTHLEQNIKDRCSIKKHMNYIVDPDWDKGRSQEQLFRTILKRLRSEHNLDFSDNLTLSISDRVITYNSEK